MSNKIALFKAILKWLYTESLRSYGGPLGHRIPAHSHKNSIFGRSADCVEARIPKNFNNYLLSKNYHICHNGSDFLRKESGNVGDMNQI